MFTMHSNPSFTSTLTQLTTPTLPVASRSVYFQAVLISSQTKTLKPQTPSDCNLHRRLSFLPSPHPILLPSRFSNPNLAKRIRKSTLRRHAIQLRDNFSLQHKTDSFLPQYLSLSVSQFQSKASQFCKRHSPESPVRGNGEQTLKLRHKALPALALSIPRSPWFSFWCEGLGDRIKAT